MGSAGHAFVSHTKSLSPAAQTKDGGYGAPPQPVRLLPGMAFWARRARRKRLLVVTRLAGELAHCKRVDEGRERLTARCERLLAADEEGRGVHYRFAGYQSRQSGYRTVARLVAVHDGRALLCLPEWHPRRPAWIFADLVPGDAEVGDWLSLRADLDAARAGHLRPRNMSVSERPPEELAARALVEDPAPPPPAEVPDLGPGCGDIVLWVTPEDVARLGAPANDRLDKCVFVSRNRPPARHSEGLDPTELPAGAGVWLAYDGRVGGRYAVASIEPNPNGTLLFLGEETAAAAGPECRPFHGWRWRWWRLADGER